MATIRHFQDELTVDAALPAQLGAQGGDTLVLGARAMLLQGFTLSLIHI